jgi:predicted DsbA family dithiol-disulfide isomerase
MTIEIEIYSDYVCPFCVLFESALLEASQDFDVSIQWRPFELRPEPTPTLRPEDDYLPNAWESSVYPLARKLGVPLRLPSISPQPYSRLAHEGYQFAKQAGKHLEYNSRVFHAFFQEDRDIGNLDELTQLAGDVGLDEVDFRVSLESGEFTKTHNQALEKALALNIQSVPSVFVDGQSFQGGYDSEKLRLMLQGLST